MKKISWIFLLFISYTLQAQQVTKIDCCLDIGNKATIIINDNNTTVTTANSSATITINSGFSFTLSASANTSAGIYNPSGNLIRTLWSGVKYDAGCYTAQWDGYFDDNTTVAPLGTYTVKVLTNNVAYDWLGVLGNTSTSHTQNQFLIGNGIYDIVATNNSVYMAQGYAERDITTNRFVLSDIGANITVSPGSQSICAYNTTSNNTTVFYSGEDGYSNTNPKFIYAFNPATEAQITFTSGRQYSIAIDGRSYTSVLGYSESQTNHVLGIAASDNFLFVSRESGVIETYDLKNNSGALISTAGIAGTGRICLVGSNNLWAIVNGTPTQYSISAAGVITATGSTLNNSNASAIANNSYGSEIVIADQSTQQFKFYDATSLALKTTLGQSGGYVSNGPAVANDKFMFAEKKGRVSSPAIAFQPDGSFWLTDPGNYRLLHFNTDHRYKEPVAYVPSSRSINADPNNPTKVFADALEYQIDYSKVATNINASWKLVNNWSVGTNVDVYRQFEQTVTLSNNHTYAWGLNNLYDLRSSGAVLLSSSFGGSLEQDGSLWTRANQGNNYFIQNKQLLTGFDNNFLPLWGNTIAVATTPAFNQDITQPAHYSNNTIGSSTNPNRFFFFNPNYNVTFNGLNTGNYYHLGSIKTGGNTWEWKTSNSTGGSYSGAYPQNGWFANNGGHSENCLANVNGSNIFWHVNDELGQYTEVSRTSHFNEDGLFIGHFGTDNLTESYTGDTKFWAGNSFKTAVVKVGSDLYYLYADESKHAGIHLIKVSNLASIQEQSIALTVSKAVTAIADPGNLMNSLPVRQPSFTGNSDWIVVTAPGKFSIGERTFLKSDNDVAIGTSNYGYVKRKLSTTALSSWALTGQLSFEQSQPTFHDGSANYLDLTDQAGKVIARFEEHAVDAYARSLRLNNVVITGSDGGYSYGELKIFTSISYTYANGALVFKIGNYPAVTITTPLEAGANLSAPGFLAINQQGDYGNQYHQINLTALKFVGTNN